MKLFDKLYQYFQSVPEPLPEKQAYVFTPTKNFFSQEFHSEYLVGLQYTVRPGNEKLAQAVNEWVHNGRVILVTSTKPRQAQAAFVTGKGTVN